MRQSRFLQTGDVKSEEDETLWWVPLGLKTDPKAEATNTKALTIKEDTLRDVDEAFYKLNSNQIGFYRTNYPPARLELLGKERHKLSVEDKIGLVADSAALAVAGQGTTAGFLVLVEKCRDEKNKAYVSCTTFTGETLTVDLVSGLRLSARWAIFDPSLQTMMCSPVDLKRSLRIL